MDVIASPTLVAFNAQSGGHQQVLSPGQTIDALVLQLLDATTARISVAGTVVDLPTQIPLLPGAIVRLAVRGHGTDAKFVIVGTSPRQPADPAQKPSPDHVAAPPLADTDELGAAIAPEHAPAAPKPVEPRVANNDPTTALATAMRTAATRQVGLAPLLADAGEAFAAPLLPPPVRQALVKLLSLPPTFEGSVSAADIKQGLKQSGVFLEAHLADPSVPFTPPTAAPDLKAALLTLRHTLNAWVEAGQQVASAKLPATRQDLEQLAMSLASNLKTLLPENNAKTPRLDHSGKALHLDSNVKTPHLDHNLKAPPPESSIKAPPPPYRGAPTTGQGPVAASLEAHAPPDLIRDVLIERTEGALARMTLLQSASLADGGAPHQARSEASGPHWNFEMPFVTPQGFAVAHFEIARDGHKAAAQDPQAAVWRANFSLDLEPMGPVHAQISVTGQRAAVRLWAERRATAAALRAGSAKLTQALHEVALESSEVLVREGVPPRPVKPPAGRFLDRAT